MKNFQSGKLCNTYFCKASRFLSIFSYGYKVLTKRVETWHNVLLSAKVEYNAEIMALRNDLEEMFEVSEEKENSENNFETKMLKLIELRNKKSIELGFENYVHLTFETNGLGYKWFLEFTEKMDKHSFVAYQALVEKAKTDLDIEQFEQRNAFQLIGKFYANNDPVKLKEENNIELVKTTLNNIGINYDTLPAKLIEIQLPPSVGGQGLMINIPNDFRAVMTLGMDVSVWLHEMGHGLHGLYNTINTPILEGYEWIPGNANPSFSEGMAETTAWFSRNFEWQMEYSELSKEEVLDRQETTKMYAPAFIRYHLYNYMKETELYLHPEKNYAEIQVELARKYLMVETKEIRTQKLQNIIYVSYPLYLQNYLIADMVAAQVHKTLFDKFGKNYAFNKDVGDYLSKTFFSTGEYFGWNERLINGTGEDLNIKAYFEFYNIR